MLLGLQVGVVALRYLRFELVDFAAGHSLIARYFLAERNFD